MPHAVKLDVRLVLSEHLPHKILMGLALLVELCLGCSLLSGLSLLLCSLSLLLLLLSKELLVLFLCFSKLDLLAFASIFKLFHGSILLVGLLLKTAENARGMLMKPVSGGTREQGSQDNGGNFH